MAETNDQDEPPVPTSLILRMTARLSEEADKFDHLSGEGPEDLYVPAVP